MLDQELIYTEREEKDLKEKLLTEKDTQTEITTNNVEDPQYHNPNDLRVIQNQIEAIEQAKESIEKLNEEISEKDQAIQEKDDLISKANQLISNLQDTLEQKNKDKDEIIKEVESNQSSAIIARAIEFAELEKERALKEAQGEVEKIIQNAKNDAEAILNKANEDAEKAEQRKNSANELYLDVVEKLKGYGIKINEILSESKKVEKPITFTKKEKQTPAKDKEVQKNPEVKKEDKGKSEPPKVEVVDSNGMNNWNQFEVSSQSEPIEKKRKQTDDEIALAKKLKMK